MTFHNVRHDERGIAMITVMGAMFVMTLLTIVAVQFSQHSLNTTSTNRARAQGSSIAQGGLDATFQKLATVTDTKTLPCGTQAGVTVPSGPTTSTYTVTLTYYSTFPVTNDAAMTCSQISAGSVPAAAELKSVGSTNSYASGPPREMDAMVRLTASASGPTFDMAIYSDSSMGGGNNGTVDQYQVANDANIYTNGDVTCGNSFVDQGTVYVQGTFTGTNTCSVGGNVYSANGFTMSGNSQIGGNVTVSNGNLSLGPGQANIAGYGYASGTCTVQNPASITHGCQQNMTGLAPPKSEPFPQLNYDAAAWSSQGYVIKNEGSNCSAVYTDVTNMATATSPTVIYTTCALTWSGNTSITTNQDLAIVSTGGITMDNKKVWDSTNTTTHKLELIVPYSAGTKPCTTPSITMTNNSKAFSQYLTLFMYTPCVAEIDNLANFYGQIYAGQVIENNHFTMHYRPIGAVPGGPVATAPAYLIGIQYEREVTP